MTTTQATIGDAQATTGTTDTATAPELAPFIQFHQFHKPGLPDGDYHIVVTQTFKTQGGTNPIPEQSTTSETLFTVAGERFLLKPADIRAVFPPEESLGRHSHVLPHVVLNRSTLPWERTAMRTESETDAEATPWLALLLFAEDDKPLPAVVPVSALHAGQNGAPFFPAFTLETGQDDTDMVTVIDVPKEQLQTLLPTIQELQFLAHVRQGTDAAGNLVGDEVAVIIGSRLPINGDLSTVHLVSIEGRYTNGQFDYQTAKDTDLIRLISLKSWRFACVNENQNFALLVHSLNSPPEGQSAQNLPATLRLPPPANPTSSPAEKYLKHGYVPLPHHLRQGQTMYSWYHGPFVTGDSPASPLPLPADTADSLLCYDTTTGWFDTSYAAAWELGRLLTLQSKQVAIALYNWKRSHVQQLHRAEQLIAHPHLAYTGAGQDPAAMPDVLNTWFARLYALDDIPFGYLVPDERLLPMETIRFFQVDANWIDCLLEGAFSIGRVPTSSAPEPNKPVIDAADARSGILLRSTLVAGWPDLQVDASLNDGTLLPSLRKVRLASDVLLCLFAGQLDSVCLYNKPEALHFGLDRPDDDASKYDPAHLYKKLRDSDGVERAALVTAQNIPWRQKGTGSQGNQWVLNITDLATAITAAQSLPVAADGKTTAPTVFTAAQFAFQMVESTEKVEIRRGS